MVSKKKLPKVLEKDEVLLLLESFNIKSWSGLRNRVIFECLYRTGLRVSELCKLKYGHINMNKRLITVHEGKGKKDRVVPYNSELAYWFQLWSEKRPQSVQNKKASCFFCQITKGRAGQPLCQQYLDKLIKRKANAVNIHSKLISCHVFRHTYASELLEEGFSIREVQELLGHSSVQTTMIYTHVNPQHLVDKINNRGDGSSEKDNKIQELENTIHEMYKMLSELKCS